MIENVAQAAEFISEHGNVARDPMQLLSVPPTELQLSAAMQMCLKQVQIAFNLLRQHHGMPLEKVPVFHQTTEG